MSDVQKAIVIIQSLVEQLKRMPEEADYGQEADAIHAAELFVKEVDSNQDNPEGCTHRAEAFCKRCRPDWVAEHEETNAKD